MPDQRILSEMARRAIDEEFALPKDADEKLRSASHYNIFRHLLNEMTKASITFAVQNSITEDEFEWDVLPDAIGIVRAIQYAFVSNPRSGDPKNWKFWKHEDFIVERIKNKDVPEIHRSELESAATRYLDSQLRAAAVDRILIDSLMAMEIFAFGDEMLNPEKFYKSSPLKRPHALWTYLSGQFANFVFFGIIIGVIAWLNSHNVLGDTATFWSIGILLLILALAFVVGTVSLPWVWISQGASKRKITDLLGAMTGVYTELKSDGAISAQHIRQRAQAVASQGAVWPAPLFAMLDDVIARTGRF
jgi:hypothetical protein